MDLNRRHLIGATASGIAGAMAVSPDAAHATQLTSAIGRDVTQYGVRPGSPCHCWTRTCTYWLRNRGILQAAPK